MGRTVRKVPKGWQHPKDESGKYIPLMEGPYTKNRDSWIEEKLQWDKGLRRDWSTDEFREKEDEYKDMAFREWSGECPDKTDYMPEWSEEEKTHFQMYEDTTEGTPLSPVMETPEELARWLVDNKASFFGGKSTTYEHWLDICGGGCGLPMFVAPAAAGI